MDAVIEEWRHHPEFSSYEISDYGRVRKVGAGRCRKQLVRSNDGRMQVNLSHNNYKRGRPVHRLVLEAFVGPCPEGMECRHLNGDPHDNRLVNLRWGTKMENAADRIAHGRSPRGERHGAARLTDELVVTLRLLHHEGWSPQELADRLGMPRNCVARAVNGETWAHVA